jgi:hypothetical protein
MTTVALRIGADAMVGYDVELQQRPTLPVSPW